MRPTPPRADRGSPQPCTRRDVGLVSGRRGPSATGPCGLPIGPANAADSPAASRITRAQTGAATLRSAIHPDLLDSSPGIGSRPADGLSSIAGAGSPSGAGPGSLRWSHRVEPTRRVRLAGFRRRRPPGWVRFAGAFAARVWAWVRSPDGLAIRRGGRGRTGAAQAASSAPSPPSSGSIASAVAVAIAGMPVAVGVRPLSGSTGSDAVTGTSVTAGVRPFGGSTAPAGSGTSSASGSAASPSSRRSFSRLWSARCSFRSQSSWYRRTRSPSGVVSTARRSASSDRSAASRRCACLLQLLQPRRLLRHQPQQRRPRAGRVGGQPLPVGQLVQELTAAFLDQRRVAA